MAVCPVFTAFARDALRGRAAEIGMHLHAWNSPPLDRPLTTNDYDRHPPLIAYPADVVRAKVSYMTALLENTFGIDVVSHRAGRWGLDGTYLAALIANGYKVDCSVTPHMHWRYGRLETSRERIVDYRAAPERPYRPSLDDVTRPGNSALLELPMTVVSMDPAPLRRLRRSLPPTSLMARVLARAFEPHVWLRPRHGNLHRMKWLLDEVHRQGRGYAQLIQHLGVRMTAELPAGPDQLSLQLLRVVDLTVEHQDDPAIARHHRLRTGRGQVDHRECVWPSAMPAGASTQAPRSSGPRWCSVAVIAPMASASACAPVAAP